MPEKVTSFLPNSVYTQGQLQTPHSLGSWVSLLSFLMPIPDPSQNLDEGGVAALQKRNVLRLPFPSPGDLPNLGMESRSPALQADSLPAELSVFWRIQYAYLPFQCQLRLTLPLQLKYRDFSTILVPFSSSVSVVIVLRIKYTHIEITLENFKIFFQSL